MQVLQGKVSKKAPYSQYSDLEKEGVTIVWGDPTSESDFPSDSFDIVYDNNGKSLDTCQPLINKFKVPSRQISYDEQSMQDTESFPEGNRWAHQEWDALKIHLLGHRPLRFASLAVIMALWNTNLLFYSMKMK